jgi:hypothetical protein
MLSEEVLAYYKNTLALAEKLGLKIKMDAEMP